MSIMARSRSHETMCFSIGQKSGCLAQICTTSASDSRSRERECYKADRIYRGTAESHKGGQALDAVRRSTSVRNTGSDSLCNLLRWAESDVWRARGFGQVALATVSRCSEL